MTAQCNTKPYSARVYSATAAKCILDCEPFHVSNVLHELLLRFKVFYIYRNDHPAEPQGVDGMMRHFAFIAALTLLATAAMAMGDALVGKHYALARAPACSNAYRWTSGGGERSSSRLLAQHRKDEEGPRCPPRC
jgi:hypothetical protein